MNAIYLIIELLEKISVLLSTALVLVLLRPADVWLGETGRRASPRRRLFLFAMFAPLAVWGSFLSVDLGEVGFNTRAVGVIAAGFLGGRVVGTAVGAVAGGANALFVAPELAGYVMAASIIDGGLAGWIARLYGTRLPTVAWGSVFAQICHHVFLGALFFALDWPRAIGIASDIELHAAKIAANTVGVSIFMALLNLARELEQARRGQTEARADARTARLEALQYQLRPHFLFNLLNTLAQLIRTDPPKARELTLDLAAFLRYTLSDHKTETTLGDEIAQIERYVDLERARFGDGLDFEIEPIEPDLLARVRVPPLILQPLVENAIRHGQRSGRVRVRVGVARRPQGGVRVEVADDGPGPQAAATRGGRRRPGRRRQGIGLMNVAERLARFTDEPSDLKLETSALGGAVVSFTLGPDAIGDDPASLSSQARRRIQEAVAPPDPGGPA